MRRNSPALPRAPNTASWSAFAAARHSIRWRTSCFYGPGPRCSLGSATPTTARCRRSRCSIPRVTPLALSMTRTSLPSNNFFLHAGCDLGYSFPYFNFPFVILHRPRFQAVVPRPDGKPGRALLHHRRCQFGNLLLAGPSAGGSFHQARVSETPAGNRRERHGGCSPAV